MEGYFKGNPGKMLRQADSPEDNPVFRFVSNGPIPARFGLIVGDALQNLRSSLDYLVWELVLAANGHPSKDNMFPICSTEELFMQQVSRGRLAGMSPDAVAEVKSLQPYHLGQDFNKSILWALDELVNVNKHRRILLTNLMAAPVLEEDIFTEDGRVWVREGPGPVRVFDRDTQFSFPLIDGKVHVDKQILAAIAFDEGHAKGMEIGFCGGYWTNYLLEILLPRFEKLFL